MKKNKFGCFVGRMCPIHLGHKKIIEKMMDEAEKCLVVMGSANHALSMRHVFSYEERRNLVKKIFPSMPVVGLADFSTDGEWIVALDDILSAAGMDPAETVFFGGCQEDIQFFLDAGRKTAILNRFDGSTPKISATEVRDALVYGRSLDGLLDPLIQQEVKELFAGKWEKLNKM